jgi:hypothetical protein
MVEVSNTDGRLNVDCIHQSVYVDMQGNEVCTDCGAVLPPAMFDDPDEYDEPLSPLERALLR